MNEIRQNGIRRNGPTPTRLLLNLTCFVGDNFSGCIHLTVFVTQQESTGYTVQAQNQSDDVPSFGSIPVFGACQGCLYRVFVSTKMKSLL